MRLMAERETQRRSYRRRRRRLPLRMDPFCSEDAFLTKNDVSLLHQEASNAIFVTRPVVVAIASTVS
jgi:hypothetical protein